MSKKITVTVHTEGLDEQAANQVAAFIALKFRGVNVHAQLVDKLSGAAIRSLAGDEYALGHELGKVFAIQDKIEDNTLLVIEAK
jgi:TolB-like protein